MKPLMAVNLSRHPSELLSGLALRAAARRLVSTSSLHAEARRPFLCIRCQYRNASSRREASSTSFLGSRKQLYDSRHRRTWSSSPRVRRSESELRSSVAEGSAGNAPSESTTMHLAGKDRKLLQGQDDRSNGKEKKSAAVTAKVEATSEGLPSHWDRQRWTLSKRLSRFMDEVLAKLAIATQRVNSYTGTDYSGIQALREEIAEQETLVKSRHAAVQAAKAAADAARGQQASSQKEVVGLLERKSSWSAADLERYMALIRSEHVNEQQVQAALESLSRAERALEDARSRLESKERARYHEEQIWSDTIRRNGTWVTFGLMGVNVLILLASLVVVEPWRRRRLVREIRGALEENRSSSLAATEAAVAAVAGSTAGGLVSGGSDVVEKEIDAVMEPEGIAIERLEAAQSSIPVESIAGVGEDNPRLAQSAVEHDTAATAATSSTDTPLDRSSLDSPPSPHFSVQSRSKTAPARSWLSTPHAAQSYMRDLFSDRQVSVRKLDVTIAALEGAAAGAAVMAVLFALLRPR